MFNSKQELLGASSGSMETRQMSQRTQTRIIRFDEQVVAKATLDNLSPCSLDRQVVDACQFVTKNMRVAAFKDVERSDWPQFDMAAVFEAIVNAAKAFPSSWRTASGSPARSRSTGCSTAPNCG